MLTRKQIAALQDRLKREADEDHAQRTRKAELSLYAKKSNVGARKGNRSKAEKDDINSKGARLPGSAFSKS